MLTYCTNVHPARDVPEIHRNLKGPVLRVARALGGKEAFPLGLHLPEPCITAYSDFDDALLRELREILDEGGMWIASLNVFPQMDFQSERIKARVYLPDWADIDRYNYTIEAGYLLAGLLPEHIPVGTISTLPLGWDHGPQGRVNRKMATAYLAQVARVFGILEAETGKRIILCIEPEPLCHLGTTSDLIRWFEDDLLPIAHEVGIEEALVRRYIGACFDVCHSAVMFEDPARAMGDLERSGITIGKMQLSCALGLVNRNDQGAGYRELLAFDESRYLHQVAARRSDGTIATFSDLPDLVAAHPIPDTSWEELRCHFHVPIHSQVAGPLMSTQSDLLTALKAPQRNGVVTLEVETYTFDVLPEMARRTRLEDSIVDEMRFAARQLNEGQRGPS